MRRLHRVSHRLRLAAPAAPANPPVPAPLPLRPRPLVRLPRLLLRLPPRHSAPAAPAPKVELTLPAGSTLPKEHVAAIKAFAEAQEAARRGRAGDPRSRPRCRAGSKREVEAGRQAPSRRRCAPIPTSAAQKYDATIASAAKAALEQFARPATSSRPSTRRASAPTPSFIASLAKVHEVTAEPGHQQVNAPAPSRPKSLADFYENPK
jgi:hypothetical protein